MVYKVDANQNDIVKAARKLGATVQILSAVGHGCPDLLIGFKGVNYLVEVKDGSKPNSARHLTFMQKNWFSNWNGQAYIIECIDDLLKVLI